MAVSGYSCPQYEHFFIASVGLRQRVGSAEFIGHLVLEESFGINVKTEDLPAVIMLDEGDLDGCRAGVKGCLGRIYGGNAFAVLAGNGQVTLSLRALIGAEVTELAEHDIQFIEITLLSGLYEFGAGPVQ